MTNLMLINESIVSGYSLNSLNLLTIGAIISGILVITATNPLISVLFLIALFVNIAGYLIVLEINFIGLAYITVYVGAIAILFLFVIFLLDIKLAELHQDNSSSSKKTAENAIPLAIIIGVGFLSPLYSIIPSNISLSLLKSLSSDIFNQFNSLIIPISNNDKDNNNLNLIELDNLNDKVNHNLLSLDIVTPSRFINLHDGNFSSFSQISSIGNIMYTSYIIWFFVAAIILLLAMVAAISLTSRDNS